jgi:hypothetical protein
MMAGAPVGSYRRYRRLVALYPLVLGAYLLIAWADWWLPRHVTGEVFPFFSWDLFSSPRQDGRLYTIRITAVADRYAPAARLLDRTLDDPRVMPLVRDPRFQKTARSLARAHWKKRADRVERLSAQLGNFVRPYGITEYELVYLSYHPLRYYLGEEVPEPTPIARYSVQAMP